ncbi:MAG: hypothetical protein ACLQMU_12465 [Methanoregula sp.]|uniref:hypothetical protein n=1 Tax=Methanoregula sp. TaxID=2052170 RepID=UPI003FD7E3A4
MEPITDFELAWRILSLSALSSAFVATLYTLFSKDYRLKAGSNSLLLILFALCCSTLLALFAALFDKFQIQVNLLDLTIINTSTLLLLSVILFTASVLGLFWVFLKSYSRIYHLKEKRYLKHIFPFRLITNWLRSLKTYELGMGMEPRNEDQKLFKSLPFKFINEEIKIINDGYSFLFIGRCNIDMSNLALQLLIDGLENNETANYVCIDKHPITIWNNAKKINPIIKDKNHDIVFIDGYTPNYGFDDEILAERFAEIRRDGIQIITGKTIAGIHSATGDAFKIIKKNEKAKSKNNRRPNRMVYDSLSTLQDVSSPEQIRIFFNHSIPAEKSYKMVTFIIEYDDADNEVLTQLKRSVDAIIEFRDDSSGAIKLKLIKLRDIDIRKYSDEVEWKTSYQK